MICVACLAQLLAFGKPATHGGLVLSTTLGGSRGEVAPFVLCAECYRTSITLLALHFPLTLSMASQSPLLLALMCDSIAMDPGLVL